MPREGYTLQCTACKDENYISKKNKKTQTEKIELSKYCKKCQKHVNNKEKK